MKYLVSLLLATGLLAGEATAAETCTDGNAGGYACQNVDLVARLSAAQMGGSGERLSDIWGWTDPHTGEEYAIVGMYDGTAFVRLAADGTPTYLARLESTDGRAPVGKPDAPDGKFCNDDCDAEASIWRDVKVLGNYALVVSEATGHGMQVFDLTRLRSLASAITTEFVADAYYDNIGHAHNVVVNEAYQRAYIVGSGSRAAGQGGLHIVDMADPLNPTFLGAVNGDGYTHDAQCVAYSGPAASVPQGNDICFAANEDTLTIWDVTSPQSPEMLSRTGYGANFYTHQVWVSEDQRYAYLNDELDEAETGSRTNTRIFDISDPRNPVFVGEHFAPTWAIDHNNYVKGRFLYQSNYLAGLRILDIDAPEAPVEAGFFDVSTADMAAFSGTWSNYPFLDSGLVLLSDVNLGLFVLRPTLDATSPQADLAVNLDVGAETGGRLPFSLQVDNNGGITVEGLLVRAHLPRSANLEIATTPTGWTCSVNDSVVSCRTSGIAAGESASLELTAASDGASASRLLVASAYGQQVDVAPADNRVQQSVSLPAGGNSGAASSGGGVTGLLLAGLLLGFGAAGWRRCEK